MAIRTAVTMVYLTTLSSPEGVRFHVRVKIRVTICSKFKFRVNNCTACYKYSVYNQCVL